MTPKRKTRTAGMKKRLSRKTWRYRRQQGYPTGIFPRGLARSVAKSTMQRSGWHHINDSFRLNWQKTILRITGKEKKAS